MHRACDIEAAHSAAHRQIRVLAMSGSQRRDSYNTALLHAAQNLAHPAMAIEIYDLAPLPMYNDDVRNAGYPPSVAHLRKSIQTADALLIASPEYNRSVPALLKNAIDWASRRPDQPFKDKPIAIMGVSNGAALGAAFSNYHLRQIFVYLDARVLNGPEVMIGNAKMKFDATNRLTDAPTCTFVADHLRKLARLVTTSEDLPASAQ